MGKFVPEVAIMNLFGPVIIELARTWRRLHGAAAEAHLIHMVERAQRSGDSEDAATYQRVLDQLEAMRAEPEWRQAVDIS